MSNQEPPEKEDLSKLTNAAFEAKFREFVKYQKQVSRQEREQRQAQHANQQRDFSSMSDEEFEQDFRRFR
jgi:hypothetical protein